MSSSEASDLRSRARLLLLAAIAVDIAAVAALLLPLARGGEVTEMLPLALILFVASSALLLGHIALRRKADEADSGV